jgi:ribosome-binding protein aMBF1 (putative translation factor)
MRRRTTAGELAKKLDIPESMVSHYKNLKHLPSIEEFMRIVDVLGFDPMEILCGEGSGEIHDRQSRAVGRQTRRPRRRKKEMV